MKVAHSFFIKPSYITCKSFNELKNKHTLDVWSCSDPQCKQVRDINFIPDVDSDQSAVEMSFHMNIIKIQLKATELNAGDIDWAGVSDETNKSLYNN